MFTLFIHGPWGSHSIFYLLLKSIVASTLYAGTGELKMAFTDVRYITATAKYAR